MGRQKKFDEDEVLEKAMFSFWKNGYEKTTTRQLETDMGINQFSIYATFKDKKELYRQVLAKYPKHLDLLFLKPLKREGADIKDIKAFLEHFAVSIKKNKIPNSCLMVTSATKFENFDADIQSMILTFFDYMKQLFQQALQNSVQTNLIAADTDLDLEAEYLVGIAQSISIYSKVKSIKEIKKYIQHALDKVK